MRAQSVRLKLLLRERHWQTHETFRTEYDRAARKIDPSLVGSGPSRAQFHRWLSGNLKGLPYPDHCRVLECMLPEWKAPQLFETCTDVDERPRRSDPKSIDISSRTTIPTIPPVDLNSSGLLGAFVTRSDFLLKMPLRQLVSGAREIRASGLSLNVLCQQFPERELLEVVSQGVDFRLLFLDPLGEATARQEREEGHVPGHLASLTSLNMQAVNHRVQEMLPSELRRRIQVRTYDETIRFNLLLIDDRLCAFQPYLPKMRGVDSPTFVAQSRPDGSGLLPMFDQLFESLWERSAPP